MANITPRLNRLMGKDGKCFDVAIDHGFFGEASFLPGIENMPHAVQTVVSANPDAVQLSIGQARLLQEIPGKNKPALVLRTDIANVYGSVLPRTLFSEIIEEPLEQAIRLDAACVVVNLFMLPGQPEVHRACIQNINKLKPLAERYGFPLMIEPLVMQDNAKSGGYMVDGDLKKILPLVRQAIELGADIIKADPTDNLEDYHKVIEVAAGKPVLVRGGGRVNDFTLFKRTEDVMRQGAMGIVYGRNVIQHSKPALIVKALMAIVHEGIDANKAQEIMAVS